MRITRSTLCLLTISCTLAGCSQTGGVRPGASSNVRTVASVGDKPLPIAAGEPGALLRAETEELDLPASSGARISGRVYDERGKPVHNAKVRLAVSSSPGGKVVYATTDRSGAFTLRGLHSGSSYTVIAEYQSEDGIVTGRAQAKAPQSDVRISLQPRGETGQGHASIRPARPRVEPISNVDPADDEPTDETRSAGQINAEDLELPAADAASITPRRTLQLSRAGTELRPPPVRAGWNPRPPASGNAARTVARSDEPSNDAGAASRSPAPDESATDLGDDGPNPLPPALDPAAAGGSHSAILADESPVKVAGGTPTRSARPRRPTPRSSVVRDDSKVIGIMDSPGEREPRSIHEDILPGGKVITPESYAPIVVTDPPETDSLPASPEKSARRSAPPSTRSAPKPPPDADAPDATNSPGVNGASAAPRRPTWRELSRSQPDVPVDESIRRASSDAQPSNRGVVTFTSAKQAARPGLSRLLGGSRPPLDTAVQQAVCRFDPDERRLVDFQLPGLDGKMVSLRDIDADLILLDFWGSWCAPCRKSIPHLSELHTKIGAKNLQVVGIACEKGSSPADRRATAVKAAKELGMGYPILVSSKDGSCPVQQALQIVFYPTLVLIDRDGRLLAREQGATDVTLARIDRAINRALNSNGDRGMH